MPREAEPADVHQQVPPAALAGPVPARDYGAAGLLVRVYGGTPGAPRQAEEPMADDAPLQAAQGELIIAHPEVEGAILRIPATSFDPTVHRPWDLSLAPWRDGAGNPLPGAEAPAPKPRGKRKAAGPDDEA